MPYRPVTKEEALRSYGAAALAHERMTADGMVEPGWSGPADGMASRTSARETSAVASPRRPPGMRARWRASMEIREDGMRTRFRFNRAFGFRIARRSACLQGPADARRGSRGVTRRGTASL
jgi:hypothetical protein